MTEARVEPRYCRHVMVARNDDRTRLFCSACGLRFYSTAWLLCVALWTAIVIGWCVGLAVSL